jgi:hypothetical protein
VVPRRREHLPARGYRKSDCGRLTHYRDSD